jgi:hypothetical protein
MSHLLDIFHGKDIVGAVGSTVAAIDTNHRLILFAVPEDSAVGTGLGAVTTAYAKAGFEAHAATLSINNGLGGAHTRAGRGRAGTADDDHKALPYAARRANMNAGTLESALAQPPNTGKHA